MDGLALPDVLSPCFSKLCGARKIIGFPFRKPSLKIGFPQLFRAFRKQSEVLAIQGLDIYSDIESFLYFTVVLIFKVSGRKSLS